MKLLDIRSEQQRRKGLTTTGVLSAHGGRYSFPGEGAGLNSELVDLISAFSEAYCSVMGIAYEKLDTIEW